MPEKKISICCVKEQSDTDKLEQHKKLLSNIEANLSQTHFSEISFFIERQVNLKWGEIGVVMNHHDFHRKKTLGS